MGRGISHLCYIIPYLLSHYDTELLGVFMLKELDHSLLRMLTWLIQGAIFKGRKTVKKCIGGND